MTLTKEELKEKLYECGYSNVTITDLGFTACNPFGEHRKLRLDIRGNDKVPFYNIVAVEVHTNGDDVVRPVSIRQFIKDEQGEYLYAVNIMDLTINKTPQEIERLERLALR